MDAASPMRLVPFRWWSAVMTASAPKARAAAATRWSSVATTTRESELAPQTAS